MRKVVLFTALALALVPLTGCRTVRFEEDANVKTALVEKDYERLGVVTLDASVTNILGIFTFGGKGYEDLLNEARRLYPETDTIIDIAEDKTSFTVLGVYNRFGKVLTATAIKFTD